MRAFVENKCLVYVIKGKAKDTLEDLLSFTELIYQLIDRTKEL